MTSAFAVPNVGQAYAQYRANGSTTPEGSSPSSIRPDSPPVVRNGVLTIRLSSARNLALPAHLPPAIEEAISSTQGQSAVSVTPSSVLEERSKKYYSNGNANGNAPDR